MTGDAKVGNQSKIPARLKSNVPESAIKELKQSKLQAVLPTKRMATPVDGVVAKVDNRETGLKIINEHDDRIGDKSDDEYLKQVISEVLYKEKQEIQRSYSDLYTEAIASVRSKGFTAPKFYENPRSKLARSRSLNMMEPKRVSTLRMWKGVYRTKDIQPVKSTEEHNKRVLSREGVPWLAQGLPQQ